MRGNDPERSPLHHGLYEAHLPVTDIARSTAFYIEKLGFERGFSAPDGSSVLLCYSQDDVRWMLGLFAVDDVEHRHAAEYHISFRVAEAEVDRMVPSLRERGIEPLHPPTAPRRGPMKEPIVHGWMPAAAVFFRDPDGHLLELIADLSDASRPDVVYQPLSAWRALTSSD